MHLDRRRRHGSHRIGYRHRCVCVTASVQHNAVVRKTHALYLVDDFALDIRLKIVENNRGKALPQTIEADIETDHAVDFGFAPPKQIEVGTVDNRNFHNFFRSGKITKNIAAPQMPKKHYFCAMKKLVIFDLDGTLLNTIADLGMATNYALQQCGFATHELAAYNAFVGNGINKLFERALPESERDPLNISRIREQFLLFYGRHNCDHTRPYEGIESLLKNLQAKGIKIAVASNKYQAATERLVRHFFPEIAFVAVFGQRDGVPLKPDPQVVADILQLAHCAPSDTLYVGDSGTDMQTAQNADLEAVGVTWGFRPRSDLEQFAPAHIVDSPDEIAAIASR